MVRLYKHSNGFYTIAMRTCVILVAWHALMETQSRSLPHRFPQSPFIPTDAKIVVGAVAPASPDPIPLVLLPGFEYRLREWRHPDTENVHWVIERRKSAQQGENDE